MEGSNTVIDDQEYATEQAPNTETQIELLLNQRAERKRRRRRAVNNDLWQQHHLGIAESLRALAAEQERKAASLAESEETSP
jgi:hypothetical protein